MLKAIHGSADSPEKSKDQTRPMTGKLFDAIFKRG